MSSASPASSSSTRLRAVLARTSRRASAPVGAYVDAAGELHHRPGRRRSEEDCTRPAWERARTHAPHGHTRRPSYHAAPAYEPSPPSSWDEHRPASAFRPTLDEDGLPQTPRTPSSAWSARLRKLHRPPRTEDWDDGEEDVPLPTPFAAALAEPLYIVDEPELAPPAHDHDDDDDDATHQAYHNHDDDVYVPSLALPSRMYSCHDSPSCSYVVRRKYIALSMRIRFSIYHAKSRLRRCMSAAKAKDT
jgi:hypothetical protein